MDANEPISRGDFLKLKFLNSKQKIVGFYEEHSRSIRPDLILSQHPNIHFLELSQPSDSVLSDTAFNILNYDSLSRPKLISPDLLAQMSKENISASYGGFIVPPNLFVSDTVKNIELVMGALIASASSVDIINNLKNKKISRRGFSALAAVTAINFHQISSNFFKLFHQDSNTAPEILVQLQALSSDFHPEETVIFLRNAIMAKKLDLIAKENLKVSFQVGAAHGGIEHFLALGPEITTTIICAYPKEFLQSIIDMNGGLDAFCSSVIIPVKPNLADPKANIKTILVDHDLKSALAKKLAS